MAERTGLEPATRVQRISNLVIHKERRIPSDPLKSPSLALALTSTTLRILAYPESDYAVIPYPKSKEFHMASATVTSKGQITLPKSVRDRLGIEAGDRLEFVESKQGFLVVAATRDIRSLKGGIGRPKKPVTIEDMNSAIEKMGRMP